MFTSADEQFDKIMRTNAPHRIESWTGSIDGSYFVTFRDDLSGLAVLEVMTMLAALRPEEISLTGAYTVRIRLN